MKITIAHLYYDLLNLYGECGNVRILKKILEEQNVDVVVKFLTVDDKLNFEDYDFVYMGMGIEDNLKIANKHLKKYKKDIEESIDHVGIYCGKNKKGEATWCHCSSSKGGVVYEVTDIFTHYYSANDYLSE